MKDTDEKALEESGNSNQGDKQNTQPNVSRLRPDFQQAERFLKLLDEEAEFFTFQTFDDNKDRKQGNLRLIRRLPVELLCKLTRLRLGAGI